MRGERSTIAVVGAALLLDAGALLLVGAVQSAWALVPAGLLHVAAAAAMLAWRSVEPSRRLLAAAICFALPLFGIALAVATSRLRGQGGDDLLARHEPVQRAESGAELARRLTASGTICDALLAAEVETRSAVVTALQRDPDARAITLLRRLLAHADPDRALEAALALEEISAQYSERSRAASAEAARRPSRDTALAAAEVIASTIHNGLADLALLPALGAQARDLYRKAADFDAQRAPELAWSRARLELAMLDPEAALALLEPVLEPLAADPRLRELHRDAAYAARRFELLAPIEPSPLPALPVPAEPVPVDPDSYYEELELRHEPEARPAALDPAAPRRPANAPRPSARPPQARRKSATLATSDPSFHPRPLGPPKRPVRRPPRRRRGAR